MCEEKGNGSTKASAKVTKFGSKALCYDRASWAIIFFPSIPFSLFPYHCTTDTLLSLLVRQDALRTVRFLPYLLHALPSPILYYLRVHQCLLMRTLHAPPMPAPPHCYLMYHRTVGARYQASLTCVTPRPLYVF